MIEKGRTYYAHLKQLIDWDVDEDDELINQIYATVTIAAAWKEEHLGWAGIAWCSPRDQFCKRIGRRIAEGRMLNHKTRRAFNLPPGAHKAHPWDLIHAATQRFNEYYLDGDGWPGAPSWTRMLELTPRRAA